jgi:hypothetical protein
MTESPIAAAPSIELNPWLSMWTQPRRTMRQILTPDPWEPDAEHGVYLLFALGGVSNRLDRADYASLGDKLAQPWPVILALAVVSGIVFGLTVFPLYSFLVHWTGRWFGGKGSSKDVRAAMAWPNVIVSWGFLLWIPMLLLFGGEMFSQATPRIDGDLRLLVAKFLLSTAELVVAVWFTVVLFKSLSEAQGYSVWRAIGNSLAAGLVLLAPLALLLLACRGFGR